MRVCAVYNLSPAQMLCFRNEFIPQHVSAPKSQARCFAIGRNDNCKWSSGLNHTTATTKNHATIHSCQVQLPTSLEFRCT